MKSLNITKIETLFKDGKPDGVRLQCMMHETYDKEEYDKYPDQISLNGITFHKMSWISSTVNYFGKK